MTNSKHTYRPISEADLPFLKKVYRESRQAELDMLLNWSETQKDEFITHQFIAQHEHYQKHYVGGDFLVIEVENESVGRLYIEEYEDEFRIIDIALLINWRGKGIGKSILEEIIEKAESKGKAVRIHVEKNNPALGLYQFLGFKEIEDKGVYWFMEKTTKKIVNADSGF